MIKFLSLILFAPTYLWIVAAFIPYSNEPRAFSDRPDSMLKLAVSFRRQETSLRAQDDKDGESDEASNESDSFYRDLEKAKQDKLGADIPKDQLEASAQDSEMEFLQAMQQARQEFQDARNSLGSKGAIDLFMEKIENEEWQSDTDDDASSTSLEESNIFDEDGAFE